MKIARQMGRRIPEDLAIVGFDDIPEAPYFDPALTTVRQDMTEMGREGVRQLICKINNPEQANKEPIRLQPELIVRGSSLRSDSS
jgi:DNA-binding LacI/PurR family transcriptional regulator